MWNQFWFWWRPHSVKTSEIYCYSYFTWNQFWLCSFSESHWKWSKYFVTLVTLVWIFYNFFCKSDFTWNRDISFACTNQNQAYLWTLDVSVFLCNWIPWSNIYFRESISLTYVVNFFRENLSQEKSLSQQSHCPVKSFLSVVRLLS